jgi:hypothetical protein
VTPAHSSPEYMRHWRNQRTGRNGQPGKLPTKPCGTLAAYRRHLWRGEEPCQPCKDANAAEWRRRYGKT